MKKYIPNILTSFRIVAIPFIIYLGIFDHYILLIILAALVALTDSFDGMLARKWNVVSELGGVLDAVADKLLAISLLIILIYKNHSYFYILILECVIGFINAFFYVKKGVGTSLLVGKLKTWFIFISIIIGFVGLILPITPYVNIAIYLTFGLQIVTFISYIIFWININKDRKKKLLNDYVEYYEIVEPILTNSEFKKRKEYPHHIDESVYEHVLRVSFDCYTIGKKLHLDYKSLAIAGLLHDFYEKPWQYNPEKLPLFKKHAFTHAKNAVKNAKQVFGEEMINKNVENIMITHMFPVNIKIPKGPEAWLITLVDKIDSIDFIMHPVALAKIFMRIEYDQSSKITLNKIKKILEKRKKNKKNNAS